MDKEHFDGAGRLKFCQKAGDPHIYAGFFTRSINGETEWLTQPRRRRGLWCRPDSSEPDFPGLGESEIREMSDTGRK